MKELDVFPMGRRARNEFRVDKSVGDVLRNLEKQQYVILDGANANLRISLGILARQTNALIVASIQRKRMLLLRRKKIKENFKNSEYSIFQWR